MQGFEEINVINPSARDEEDDKEIIDETDDDATELIDVSGQAQFYAELRRANAESLLDLADPNAKLNRSNEPTANHDVTSAFPHERLISGDPRDNLEIAFQVRKWLALAFSGVSLTTAILAYSPSASSDSDEVDSNASSTIIHPSPTDPSRSLEENSQQMLAPQDRTPVEQVLRMKLSGMVDNPSIECNRVPTSKVEAKKVAIAQMTERDHDHYIGGRPSMILASGIECDKDHPDCRRITVPFNLHFAEGPVGSTEDVALCWTVTHHSNY